MSQYLDLNGLQLYDRLIKNQLFLIDQRLSNIETENINVYKRALDAEESARNAEKSANEASDYSVSCQVVLDDILLALDASADLGADAAIAKNAADISQIKIENVDRDQKILEATPIVLTEDEYDDLVLSGEVESNRIYYIREDD